MKRWLALAIGLLVASVAPSWAVEPDAAGRFEKEELPNLDSSWLGSVIYYREIGTDSGMLAVEIKGERITYLDVPVETWEELKAAESAGRFYGERIKQKYERVQGDPLWMKFKSEESGLLQASVRCAFNEECETLILEALGEAKRSIYIAAYAFTRTKIAGALVQARRRGIDVRIKMDSRQAEYPLAQRRVDFLQRNGIPVTLIQMEGDHAAMHNKFMVIDEQRVITGSFNYTTTAVLASWENVLQVDSPEIASRYRAYWDDIFSN